jgi:hypothetical protein
MPVRRRKWVALAALLVGSIGFVLWPRTVVMAPPVRIVVVDSEGRPAGEVRIARMWHHYTLNSHGFDDSYTGQDGEVDLKQEEVRVSRAVEWGSGLRNLLRNPVHSSFGTEWSLHVHVNGPSVPGTTLVSLASPPPDTRGKLSWRCVVRNGCELLSSN